MVTVQSSLLGRFCGARNESVANGEKNSGSSERPQFSGHSREKDFESDLYCDACDTCDGKSNCKRLQQSYDGRDGWRQGFLLSLLSDRLNIAIYSFVLGSIAASLLSAWAVTQVDFSAMCGGIK